MLPIERRRQIIEKLNAERRVVVSELAAYYQVSEETIRRDLKVLEKDGIAITQYGGAVLNEEEETAKDTPYHVRKKKNLWGKRIIGGIIETLIEDGEHIIVDPSSTAVAILNALQNKRNLTVITNSIEVLVEMPQVTNWEIISTGGILMQDYMALVGPRAISAIGSMNADTVILSCKGLDMRKGVTDANEMFSQVKQTMLAAASRKILAADHTKFDQVAFARICSVWDIDLIVTDIRPSDEWMAFFEEKGIRCLYGAEVAAEGIA